MNLRLTFKANPSRSELHSVVTLRVSFHNTPTGILTFTDRDGHERSLQLRYVESIDIDNKPGGD